MVASPSRPHFQSKAPPKTIPRGQQPSPPLRATARATLPRGAKAPQEPLRGAKAPQEPLRGAKAPQEPLRGAKAPPQRPYWPKDAPKRPPLPPSPAVFSDPAPRKKTPRKPQPATNTSPARNPRPPSSSSLCRSLNQATSFHESRLPSVSVNPTGTRHVRNGGQGLASVRPPAGIHTAAQ